LTTLPPRSVAAIGAVCLIAGWLLASTLTPPVARLQSLPDAPARPAGATAQSPPAPAVQWAPSADAAPPAARRNPFSFGRRAQPQSRVASTPAAIDATLAPPAPVGPAYSLSGIGISGETRTGVVTDGQSVYIVKPGDSLGGFQVVAVGPTSVTLLASSGEHYMLRLP